jgi:hypothetical protein
MEGFLKFLQRYVVFVTGVLGALLLALGVVAKPTTDGGTILVGLGVALLATFLLALVSLSREDLLEALFREGVVEVFPSRIVRTKRHYWSELLKNVDREYRVLGVANHGYIGNATKEELYRQLITAAVARGVTVEIMWLSPTIPLARTREAEEGRATRRDIVDSIVFFWGVRTSLEEGLKPRLALKEHSHIPSCGITQADDRLTVTHYVPGQDNLDSPGWILTSAAYPFYRRMLAFVRPMWGRAELVEVYLNTYREVRSKASDITGERVAELIELRSTYEVGKPSETERRLEQFPEEGEGTGE